MNKDNKQAMDKEIKYLVQRLMELTGDGKVSAKDLMEDGSVQANIEKSYTFNPFDAGVEVNTQYSGRQYGKYK